MKKSGLLILLLSNLMIMHGQEAYKQNFLNQLKKMPVIQSLEDCFRFQNCDGSSCTAFKNAKTELEKALNELTAAQLAVNSAVTSMTGVANMTPEQAEALSEKLEQMSPEEQQQWAMQNAAAMMGSVSMHINEDASNETVNDAVEYITGQQEENLVNRMKADDFYSKMKIIEDKYEPKKNSLLKEFKTASGVDYHPESSFPYVFGEAGDEEVARFERALLDYKKSIRVVYDAELNEKLAYIKTSVNKLTEKYSLTEEKIAATNYGEDAQENINKSRLYIAHQEVLNQVIDIFAKYENILKEYAGKYASIK